MKAAVLHNFGVPLSVEQVTDPAIGTGEVLVDVVAAPVLSYTGEVRSRDGAPTPDITLHPERT
jgi:alcohol dehydrogenase